VFLGLAMGLAAFMGSLYKRLKMGNRFMDLSVDVFCVAGFDGYFKYVNPAAEKLLGFTKEELLAKPWVELIHPEDREASVAEAERVNSGENIFGFENRLLTGAGSYMRLLWNGVSVPDQQVIYAVARDITENREFLRQIELQNRELEVRNREVETSIGKLRK
jgi:PAS domain S-box-containing protein